MRLLGERSTSVKKGAFKTALSLFNICQLEKQIEEIEKLWVEEGGRLTVSCLGSQVKRCIQWGLGVTGVSHAAHWSVRGRPRNGWGWQCGGHW